MSKPEFRPDIEGLRGLAILVVVAFHCGVPGFRGGFVGVDVFFVLSGYLITGLLVAEIQSKSKLSLLNFYARRVRRLLPASTLVLLVTLGVSCLALAPSEVTFVGRAARAGAAYTSNIFFGLNAMDYFAPAVETNPMLHTWTLAVEEQFYLVWPLLIMLGLQVWRSRKALIGLLLGLVALSLVASIWFTAHGGVLAFYGLPTRAWEFGVGGLTALLWRGASDLSERFVAFGWLGLIAVVWSVHSISDSTSFPGWIALIPVLGTCAALIAGAAQPGRGVCLALKSRPMQFLGRLSYSWYLWHWPFLVFAEIFFPGCSIAGKLLACGLALGVAAVAHRLIENPIRFYPYLVKRPALSLGFGCLLTICSLAAASASIRFSTRLAQAPEIDRITARVSDIADMSRDQCLSPEQSTELKTCVFGNTSSPNNLLLFGDSHAREWFNPLRRIVTSRGWKLTTMVKATCPATDITPPELSRGLAANCTIWRAEAIRRIAEMHPSIVFIGNASYYVGRRNDSEGRSISPSEWRDGTRRTLSALTAAGLTVVLVRDNPLPSFNVPVCLERVARHAWYPSTYCEIVKSSALNPAVFQAEKAGARGLPHVHFLDLTDSFCQGDICPVIQGSNVVYRDDNHLTGGFADTLVPALAAGLDPIIEISGH